MAWSSNTSTKSSSGSWLSSGIARSIELPGALQSSLDFWQRSFNSLLQLEEAKSLIFGICFAQFLAVPFEDLGACSWFSVSTKSWDFSFSSSQFSDMWSLEGASGIDIRSCSSSALSADMLTSLCTPVSSCESLTSMTCPEHLVSIRFSSTNASSPLLACFLSPSLVFSGLSLTSCDSL